MATTPNINTGEQENRRAEGQKDISIEARRTEDQQDRSKKDKKDRNKKDKTTEGLMDFSVTSV